MFHVEFPCCGENQGHLDVKIREIETIPKPKEGFIFNFTWAVKIEKKLVR